MIGGFRSDLSITRKTDGNFIQLRIATVKRMCCFPPEGGGVRRIRLRVKESSLGTMLTLKSFRAGALALPFWGIELKSYDKR